MNLSVIIPVFNEAKHLPVLLENLMLQDFPHNEWEIIFADGRSTDNTRVLLEHAAKQYDFIRVVDNPGRYVSFGLNEAIRISRGEVIIRMDAHSTYPNDYMRKLYERLKAGQSWNVGGVWVIEAANESAHAHAIATAIAHPFAAGNAAYKRKGGEPAEVDTVPYGCFRRQVFLELGLFDTDLVRNQDDELNGRIRKAGHSIMLYPDIQIHYIARSNVKNLTKMYFGYGLYKPLVNEKLGTPATLRQFAPPLLVLSFILIPFLALISDVLLSLSLYFGGFYVLTTLLTSFAISLKKQLRLLPHLILIFPSIHFSYGLGYLAGLFKFTLFKQYSHEKQTLSS